MADKSHGGPQFPRRSWCKLMRVSSVEDRERSFDSHRSCLVEIVKLQGECVIDAAAADNLLLEGQLPPSVARMKLPGFHLGHPGIGPS